MHTRLLTPVSLPPPLRGMEAISGSVRQLVLLEYTKPVTAFKHTKQLITVFRQGLESEYHLKQYI